MPVAVKVHRVLPVRRGHKLTVAHRAGEGAFQIERVILFAARHQQERFQLAGEVLGAARIVKRQRRQRIKDSGFPHHPPPAGLDANNPDDNFRRHAVNLVRAVERILILVPECHAVLHVIRGNKLFFVAQPGAVWP